MDEPSYVMIPLDLKSSPYIYSFDIHLEPDTNGLVTVFFVKDELKALVQPVIDWLTERFGEGVIYYDGETINGLAKYSIDCHAASCAWYMWDGSVSFQHDDHAFEFRLRWC